MDNNLDRMDCNSKKTNILDRDSIKEELEKTCNSIPFTIGKTIENKPFFIDIAKIAHLLITGASKEDQVGFINNLIYSVVLKNEPEDVQFIVYFNEKDDSKSKDDMLNCIPSNYTPFFILNEVDYLNNLLKFIIHKIHERLNIMSNITSGYPIKNINEYNNLVANHNFKDYKLEHIIIIIKGLPEIKFINNNYLDILEKEKEYLKRTGIHFIVLTEKTISEIPYEYHASLSLNSIEMTKNSNINDQHDVLEIDNLLYKNTLTQNINLIKKAFIEKKDFKTFVSEKNRKKYRFYTPQICIDQEEYNEENVDLNERHRVFRNQEEYNAAHNINIDKYYQILSFIRDRPDCIFADICVNMNISLFEVQQIVQKLKEEGLI